MRVEFFISSQWLSGPTHWWHVNTDLHRSKPEDSVIDESFLPALCILLSVLTLLESSSNPFKILVSLAVCAIHFPVLRGELYPTSFPLTLSIQSHFYFLLTTKIMPCYLAQALPSALIKPWITAFLWAAPFTSCGVATSVHLELSLFIPTCENCFMN